MSKTIDEHIEQYRSEPNLDAVAAALAADGVDGGTVSRVIRRLRQGDPRDFPGYAALYQALHQAHPHLAHEFSIRFAETATLVARGDIGADRLAALFRYYTQELTLPPGERSAGIPPAKMQNEIRLGATGVA